MGCKSCGSENRSALPAEINIHFPGMGNFTRPTVWVFPQLMVCLNCGFTELVIPETELQLLVEGIGLSRGMGA
jgi:hypothetical protein